MLAQRVDIGDELCRRQVNLPLGIPVLRWSTPDTLRASRKF